MKKSTDQKNKSFMEKHEIVPEKKKRAKKSKIFDSNLENVEKGDASKAKKRSKKSNGIENEADGSSSNSKTKSLIQTKINFTEPKNKSKAKGIELTAECNPKKAAISNNITSSDSESSSQKKKKKKKKEVREPTPPPSSSSSTSSKKRKQNSESETHQEIASPKKGRHVLAPTPPRETSPKKKSRAEAFSSASSSPSTSKKRKDSVSDSQLPQSSFKREKSVEINDVGSDGEGPIDKPPNTQFDYYMMSAHNGKYEKARTAYEAMSKAAKKKLATEYNAKVQNYVVRLKSYLSSLSKQDAVKFVSKCTIRPKQDQLQIIFFIYRSQNLSRRSRQKGKPQSSKLTRTPTPTRIRLEFRGYNMILQVNLLCNMKKHNNCIIILSQKAQPVEFFTSVKSIPLTSFRIYEFMQKCISYNYLFVQKSFHQ